MEMAGLSLNPEERDVGCGAICISPRRNRIQDMDAFADGCNLRVVAEN
jgi:hypothetical protein